MPSLLEQLGAQDPDDFEWRDIGTCRNVPMKNIMFDDYENDKEIAKSADQMCLSCPVITMCLDHAVANNEWGCWGGVYFENGRIDEERNSHKTEAVWKRLEEIHGESLLP